jgi:hypothetical protein
LTSRKSQNSILFLTTLGVYLGLVLVGATPQVLAQAATAKQFSVKDEIEVKDDLDTDPKNSGLADFVFGRIESALPEFLRNSVSTSGRSIFGSKSSLPNILSASHYFCSENEIVHRTPSLDDNAKSVQLNSLIAGLDASRNWTFQTVPRFVVEPEPFNGGALQLGFCRSAAVTIATNSDELRIKFAVSQQSSVDAFTVAGKLNDALFEGAHFISDPLIKKLYERTRATSNNTDLIVETRLPRGSLDTLLATEAK